VQVKPYAEVEASPDIAAVPLPADDQATRAAAAASAAAQDPNPSWVFPGKWHGNGNSGSSRNSSGQGVSNGNACGLTKKVTETVAETVVNGAIFPVDVDDGRPVVAFSERGIPVDPANPTQWGSGAGGIYLTDGESTVVAAVVAPLGAIQLRVYDPASGDWR